MISNKFFSGQSWKKRVKKLIRSVLEICEKE